MNKQTIKDKRVCINHYAATQQHKEEEWLVPEASGEQTE